MKKITLLAFALLLNGVFIHSQKKKDLLFKIDDLKSELRTAQADLATSKKNEKVNDVKITALEEQVASLKKTNASLLNNLNTFTEVSKKESENVSKALQSLQEKEMQIRVINEVLTQYDSLKLVLLTQIKDSLVGVQSKLDKGAVVIDIPNTVLFGENDKSIEVTDNGKQILEQFSTILNENPAMKIDIQGNSNALKFEDDKFTDNWDLSARQAATVTRILQIDHQIDPKRMDVVGKSEYDTFGIDTVTRIVIDPGFDKFYDVIKEYMKNQF